MFIRAVAVFQGPEIKGSVYFTEFGDLVKVDLNIQGLKKNGFHGFHVHRCGDLTNGCESM
jgi:Cu-Zn family superoxide dismutase